jgi:hypothetical protein
MAHWNALTTVTVWTTDEHGRSRRSMVAQLNWTGRWVSRASEGVETRKQRARSDLNWAGHGEVKQLGVLEGFGGNPKLGSSRGGFEAWVASLVAQLSSGADGAVIYSFQRWWRPISWGCVGDWRGKEVLALRMSGFHRGSPPAITGHAYRDSPRRGLAFKHVAHNGERSTAAKSILAARRASGYGEPLPRPSPSWSSAKIFTPSWLSPHQRTWIAATAWITT